jgi:hypothetical protein
LTSNHSSHSARDYAIFPDHTATPRGRRHIYQRQRLDGSMRPATVILSERDGYIEFEFADDGTSWSLSVLTAHRFQSADIYQVHGVTNTLGVPSAMITSFAGGNPSQPKWFTFINVSATPSQGETGRKQRGELENQLYGRRIPRPLAYLVSGADCRSGVGHRTNMAFRHPQK